MKNNVPKLRFPEFNEEWEEKKLGDISSRIGSGSTPLGGEQSYTLSGIPLIRSQNVLNGVLDISNVSYIDNQTHLKMAVSKVMPKDILLNITGASLGRSCVVPNNILDANVNQHVCVIRPLKHSPFFIQQYVSSDNGQNKLLMSQTGSGREGLNFQAIKSYKVLFPTIKEQTKIADFLTRVDDKTQQLTKKKELLEQYKKGLMQQVFSQQIRFKDDSGNDYPNWQVNKFGAITVNVSKKNLNSTLYPIYSVNNKTGFIPQSEQFDGLDSNERNYDISLYKIVNKFTFAYNPARINVGSLGYSGELENIIISSLYVCFKTIDIIDDTFLLQYFKSNFFKKSVLQNVEGGVREYLFYDNFAKIKINTPSKSEQVKISSFLTNIDDKITQVNTQLEKTKLFKKAILQLMFI